MVVLVCYDVATTSPGGQKRLRRVAKICEGHGARVQYSLFECRLSDAEWLQLRTNLLHTIDAETDSLRFYFVDDGLAKKTEHYGVRKPIDFEGPLIV